MLTLPTFGVSHIYSTDHKRREQKNHYSGRSSGNRLAYVRANKICFDTRRLILLKTAVRIIGEHDICTHPREAEAACYSKQSASTGDDSLWRHQRHRWRHCSSSRWRHSAAAAAVWFSLRTTAASVRAMRWLVLYGVDRSIKYSARAWTENASGALTDWLPGVAAKPFYSQELQAYAPGLPQPRTLSANSQSAASCHSLHGCWCVSDVELGESAF